MVEGLPALAHCKRRNKTFIIVPRFAQMGKIINKIPPMEGNT